MVVKFIKMVNIAKNVLMYVYIDIYHGVKDVYIRI
jgi:hypothetical protein